MCTCVWGWFAYRGVVNGVRFRMALTVRHTVVEQYKALTPDDLRHSPPTTPGMMADYG